MAFITGIPIKDSLHSDFSTESGVWTEYKHQLTGDYVSRDGTGGNYHEFADGTFREYNNKLKDMAIVGGEYLYFEPYDGGLRYQGNPFIHKYPAIGGRQGAYSTRTIGFGGPLMKIRRNSDNTEVDVRGDASGNISLSSPIIDYRENLVTYSENFSEWQTPPTISSSSETDPNGGLTASTVVGRTVSATVTALSGGNTISIYAKKGTTDFLVIRTQNWDASARTWFDLTNGTVGTVGHDSAAISSQGNDWYRCSVVFSTSSDLNGNPEYVGVDSDGSTTVSTDNINIWGAQFNKGSTLEKYIKTDGSAITELDRPQESLGEYIGTATGYCSVWYDQFSTGDSQNNLTQTTAADQPIVVAGSTLVTDSSGNAALDFNGSTHHMTLDTGFAYTININDLSSFAVFQADSTAGNQIVAGLANYSAVGGLNRFYAPRINAGEFYYAYGTVKIFASGSANTNLNLVSLTADTTQGDARAFLNSSQVGSPTSLQNRSAQEPTSTVGLGAIGGGQHFNGKIGEFIFYQSDSLSEHRTAIETNINSHFKIY